MREAIDLSRIEWQRHVLERMIERGIQRDHVLGILREADIIEDYPDDHPYPSALFTGAVAGGPVHVVAALDPVEARVFVVTVYRPDLEHFESDFRTRRRR